MNTRRRAWALLMVTAVVSTVAACGGARTSKEFSPTCRAVFDAWSQYANARNHQVNAAADARLAFLVILNRGSQGASTSELNRLADGYNVAQRKLGKAEKAAARATKAYSTALKKCVVKPDAPASCRNAFRVMRKDAALHGDAHFLVKATDAIAGAFAALVQTYTLSGLTNDQALTTTLVLVKQIDKLSSKHNAYVDNVTRLQKQWEAAVSNCRAAL